MSPRWLLTVAWVALGSALACGTEYDSGFPTGGAGGQGGTGGTAGAGGTAGTGGTTSSGGGQGGSGAQGGTNTGGGGGSTVTCDSPYPEVVLADGPLAYWRLDESTCNGSCTIATEVGSFTGTLQENATGGFAVGQPGAIAGSTSVEFIEPGDGYITFGDIFEFANGATPFTLELWIHLNEVNDNGAIIGRVGNWNTFGCNTFEF
ncbi:MAG: hypothetical protein JRI68_33020, partial [Deltaproteobacteria bacterium]|nr:hypothetical protein [Deltaproteobacteria bacterium]